MTEETQQCQLIDELLKADRVGWASRAGASEAALVEASTGQQILGFDGQPIARDRPVSYPALAMPWAEYLPLLTDFEGYIPYMYLDINDYVTVAIGQMIPSPEAAVALNQGQLPFFQKSDGTPAGDSAVQSEYGNVKARTDLASRGAGAFESVTTLTVEEADAQALLKSQAESHLEELLATGNYPDFGTYPAGVQMAVTDLAFNLGVPKFIDQYVNFRAAVLNRDWTSAKEQSGRRDLGSRNVIVASWFDPPIAAQTFFIFSGQPAIPKILTMDGGLKPA